MNLISLTPCHFQFSPGGHRQPANENVAFFGLRKQKKNVRSIVVAAGKISGADSNSVRRAAASEDYRTGWD
jgi:hypothetical protein